MQLHSLESALHGPPAGRWAAHRFRLAVEFLYFGVKEARACLFAGLFFMAVFATPRTGILGIPRYDVLLIVALAIQLWMVWSKLETVDELKAICL
ncbi:MAG: DUF817 family protein, partial [Betaproteobacteria bacterium]